ncbi:unnamed protein product [Rhodiola kirilowii]
MTPFEAVYGRPPPTVLDYSPSTTKVAAVDSLLTSRTQLLATLKANIQRAKLRMKNQVDQHRTDKQFQIEDLGLPQTQALPPAHCSSTRRI